MGSALSRRNTQSFIFRMAHKKIMVSLCMNFESKFCFDSQEAYNNLPVESKVTFLLSSVHNAGIEEELRQMAAVLLRRLFTAEFMEFFPKVNTLDNQSVE